MKNETRPASTETPNTSANPRPRFLEQEPRRVPLTGTRTDEEARLAAEIEKLRG